MRTDIFARLDREPEPPKIEPPRMSSTRAALFGGTLALYVVIVAAVLTNSWLVALDWKTMLFRPYQQWPGLHAFLDYFVVLGQRGPTAVMIAAWLGWRSWRQHTLRPLLVLGASLLLLNLTVGAVKLGLGRQGPHYATQIGSPELFSGGDIFPSGHTANAVVTWGILAYLATTPRTRRYLSLGSAALSLGVGATTVYLGTHWLSDVVLGWAAGLLILLALPWFEPMIGRVELAVFGVRDRWRAYRRAARRPVTSGEVHAPQPSRRPVGGDEDQPRTGVGSARRGPLGASGPGPGRAPGASAAGPLSPSRAHHPTRPDHSPISPSGTRRPPQSRQVTGG
ncbi:phosphatase PAP2 family protein [Streptomyces fuscigenes]|uniref:phosphatase PAP2 family protein n=1 Tax=Streptomyces fuscigenes TaxID=1528880 RepID=UPI001F273E0B|nr:phosphatase PAP2 family protein [Streptomyces fuscigenes]MCF3964787.1 phosphatase PAP2 family protein [Streptomyces fuscigenes]